MSGWMKKGQLLANGREQSSHLKSCIYYHDPPSFGLVARIGVRGGCEPHWGKTLVSAIRPRRRPQLLWVFLRVLLGPGQLCWGDDPDRGKCCIRGLINSRSPIQTVKMSDVFKLNLALFYLVYLILETKTGCNLSVHLVDFSYCWPHSKSR